MPGQFVVHGDSATEPEFFVANALDKLKIPYIFQYVLWGGSYIRGGVKIDFLVKNPFAVPVEIFGNYWHSGQFDGDDKLRMARIRDHFKRDVVIFWGNELETQEMADNIVRQKLG